MTQTQPPPPPTQEEWLPEYFLQQYDGFGRPLGPVYGPFVGEWGQRKAFEAGRYMRTAGAWAEFCVHTSDRAGFAKLLAAVDTIP